MSLLSVSIYREIRAPTDRIVELESPEPKPAAVRFDFPVSPIRERVILLSGKMSGEKIAEKHRVPVAKRADELNAILSRMLTNQRDLAQSVAIGHVGMLNKPGGAS